MLIDLLVHQPRALATIVQQTPLWVWGLLAALLVLGASQLRDRSASLLRTSATPVAMVLLSGYGVLSAFGAAGQTWQAVAAWLATTVAVAGLALLLWPHPPTGTRYLSAERRFALPGSRAPLLLILGIFFTKYLVGVELALQPAHAGDGGFALAVACAYGVFNGGFLARAARLWRLALSPPAGATAPRAASTGAA